jgi:hypothetical protein
MEIENKAKEIIKVNREILKREMGREEFFKLLKK